MVLAALNHPNVAQIVVRASRATGSAAVNEPNGGRIWWAHFEFTGINIEPIILRKCMVRP
jgi:hypothetical protein